VQRPPALLSSKSKAKSPGPNRRGHQRRRPLQWLCLEGGRKEVRRIPLGAPPRVLSIKRPRRRKKSVRGCLQGGGAARLLPAGAPWGQGSESGHLRIRGTSRADSRRSGVGLAPGPQAPPVPAAALVLYIKVFFFRLDADVARETCDTFPTHCTNKLVHWYRRGAGSAPFSTGAAGIRAPSPVLAAPYNVSSASVKSNSNTWRLTRCLFLESSRSATWRAGRRSCRTPDVDLTASPFGLSQ
jgi:hypothetical protein